MDLSTSFYSFTSPNLSRSSSQVSPYGSYGDRKWTDFVEYHCLEELLHFPWRPTAFVTLREEGCRGFQKDLSSECQQIKKHLSHQQVNSWMCFHLWPHVNGVRPLHIPKGKLCRASLSPRLPWLWSWNLWQIGVSDDSSCETGTKKCKNEFDACTKRTRSWDRSRPALCRTKTNYRGNKFIKRWAHLKWPHCAVPVIAKGHRVLWTSSHVSWPIETLMHMFLTSSSPVYSVSLMLCVYDKGARWKTQTSNSYGPVLTVTYTEYNTQKIQFLYGFVFFAFCPKMENVKNNGEVFLCFCQVYFVFLGQHKAPNKCL